MIHGVATASRQHIIQIISDKHVNISIDNIDITAATVVFLSLIFVRNSTAIISIGQ